MRPHVVAAETRRVAGVQQRTLSARQAHPQITGGGGQRARARIGQSVAQIVDVRGQPVAGRDAQPRFARQNIADRFAVFDQRAAAILPGVERPGGQPVFVHRHNAVHLAGERHGAERVCLGQPLIDGDSQRGQRVRVLEARPALLCGEEARAPVRLAVNHGARFFVQHDGGQRGRAQINAQYGHNSLRKNRYKRLYIRRDARISCRAPQKFRRVSKRRGRQPSSQTGQGPPASQVFRDMTKAVPPRRLRLWGASGGA